MGLLHNHATSASARVAATLDLAPTTFAARRRKAEASARRVMEQDAAIGDITVRLRTDSGHLAQWWLVNWRPAPPTTKPDAVLHAFTAVPGEAPYALYAPGLDEALLVNTDYYGQCKSWALGLAAAIAERRGVLSVHGASLGIDGRGIILVGGTGSGKSTQVARLCREPRARLLGDDWVFVEPARAGKRPRLTQPEAALYIRTDNAANDPRLAAILEAGHLENAVTVRGQCASQPCKSGRCQFDAGKDHCLWGHPNARALVSRYALAGPLGPCKEAFLDLLVVLRRDPSDGRAAVDDPATVLAALREGRTHVGPGGGPPEPWGKLASQPYCNPYLLHGAGQQDRLFTAATRNAQTLLLNTAHLGIEGTAQRILRKVGAAPGSGPPR